MKPIEDLGKRMVTELSNRNKPLDIDFLAYATGSTASHVTKEALKLAEYNVVRVKGNTVELNKDNAFRNWDTFKK
jgi:hypothetical protein